VLALADKGWKQALADDPHLRNGLNIAFGKVTPARGRGARLRLRRARRGDELT
jgi:alanine dehydrogenase